VSISSFVVVAPPVVAHEDPECERDFSSPLTQFCQKIDVDFKKYHDEPRDLTRYIRRTQKHPDNGGIWYCLEVQIGFLPSKQYRNAPARRRSQGSQSAIKESGRHGQIDQETASGSLCLATAGTLAYTASVWHYGRI
jgi:hypothetical protein